MNSNSHSVKNMPVPGGDWLYRQGDIVLGPMPGQVLLELLYSGAIDGRTEVQRMGTQGFRPLAKVESFKLHLARAQAKLRVDAAARSQADQARRQRAVKGVLFGTVAIISAGLAAYVAVYLAVHKPWKRPDELAFSHIEMETPSITRAQRRTSEEELIAYPGARKTEEAKAEKNAKGAIGARAPAASRTSTEPDGLSQVTQFDQEAINRVVSYNQRKLHPCIAAEAQKQPGLVAKIPIEFVIANDGRVNKVWVDHPQFKTGSLPECLLKELKSWQFEPYEGERATVGLTFKIGRG